ncbi:hypothetical protein BGZ65_012042 [Modicella reniformis]|uniref:Uncharacterized protein n=1 Tax=Modicella reniformis TaxID=1440133 RepID=A0A9P6MAG8_9FUNG|nr:hypothetical protein BGZ65_012042 [Modicella reniformis]
MTTNEHSQRHHGSRRGHAMDHSYENELHSFNAGDLALRLQRLKQDQEQFFRAQPQPQPQPQPQTHIHIHTHTHTHLNTVHINRDIQKQAHDTIHEILERLERQRIENDMIFYPGMTESGIAVSHGKANLRHS